MPKHMNKQHTLVHKVAQTDNTESSKKGLGRKRARAREQGTRLFMTDMNSLLLLPLPKCVVVGGILVVIHFMLSISMVIYTTSFILSYFIAYEFTLVDVKIVTETETETETETQADTTG